VRFARTIRCAIVGSGVRKARAISPVVSPPSSRSVSATRASVDSTGWHDVKISRKRSSPMSSSLASASASAMSGTTCASSASISWPSWSRFAA
jgi:ribosomal protein L22